MRESKGAVASRVREICLAFPEVEEKVSHGAPAFFVRKQFAMVWPNGHHDNEFPHLWCAAAPGAQATLLESSAPCFRPPYVGHRGWVGYRLDGRIDWDEVAELLEDAYRAVAPARLAAQL
ncbi:MAG TPA: MmcQ/YjbR family DNA-binding protein [Mycobacteriales bacterium]|nr:MmcQ/YjbR family DNA-binding protein [Mycobacteriales bacterium]